LVSQKFFKIQIIFLAAAATAQLINFSSFLVLPDDCPFNSLV
jgi:hypothetical protein